MNEQRFVVSDILWRRLEPHLPGKIGDAGVSAKDMRCHIAAFEAMGGSPEHILYDRMKTAVIGEDEAGIVTYNTSLVALLNHYGTVPRACRPYRAKTDLRQEPSPPEPPTY